MKFDDFMWTVPLIVLFLFTILTMCLVYNAAHETKLKEQFCKERYGQGYYIKDKSKALFCITYTLDGTEQKHLISEEELKEWKEKKQ